MTVYKSLSELAPALYFAQPPAEDWLTILADGQPLRVLACPNPWRRTFLGKEGPDAGKFECFINDRTGETAGWVTTELAGPPAPLRNATAEKAALDGLTEAELGRNILVEHVRQPRVWKVPEPLPAPRKRRHTLTPRDLLTENEDPLVMLGKEDRLRIIRGFRTAMRIMCQLGDWDPSLNITGPKIADQLRFMVETLHYNVEGAAIKARTEIERVRREGMDGEVPENQISTLLWQATGYRIQEAHFKLMAHAFSLEYEAAIGNSGIKNWRPYESKAARNARSEKEYQLKRRALGARADMLMHQSEANFERWLETQGAPRRKKLMPFGPFDADGKPIDTPKPEESGIDDPKADAPAHPAELDPDNENFRQDLEDGKELSELPEPVKPRLHHVKHEDDDDRLHRRRDSTRRTPKKDAFEF